MINKLLNYPEFSEDQLKKADEEVSLIVFVNGKRPDDSAFWAFLAIPPSKIMGFKKAQQLGESFLLDEYGEIIKHGVGKEPPTDVVKEMQENYGFDPDFEK